MRGIKSLFAWEMPLCAFMLIFIGILLSIGLALLSPLLPVIIHWIARFIAWTVLGPGMKLVDIYFVQRFEKVSDKEKSTRDFENSYFITRKRRQILWTLKEHTVKMKDMLTYLYGRFTFTILPFFKCKIDSSPLLQSSAKVAEKVDFQVVVKRQKGYYLEGSMIYTEMKDQDKLESIHNLLSSKQHIPAIEKDADRLIKGGNDNKKVFVSETLLKLQLGAYRLKKRKGALLKPDPYFEIVSNPDTDKKIVYKSEYVTNNLNPLWEIAVINMTKLCKGDLSTVVRINVYDRQSKSMDKFMGVSRLYLCI